MLADEGDIYNYLGLNIKKHSDGEFELSQSHLADKIINRVGLTVSKGLKSRETPVGKQLLHKYKSILVRKCICNYRAAVVVLRYFRDQHKQKYKCPYTSVNNFQ